MTSERVSRDERPLWLEPPPSGARTGRSGIGALPPLDPAETNGEVCPTPAVRDTRRDRLSWVEAV
jgi:hypothetical protein